MAEPRVFISSTYYDLKQVRDNIGKFIESLSYIPVMHEYSGVTYSQENELENDCYREVESCDIMVGIIGEMFGSRSVNNTFSITMNEIKHAIEKRKKVYVFIAKNVYAENDTYRKNQGSSSFIPAHVDKIDVHKFVLGIRENARQIVIIPFETTDQIIDSLRKQFAGLLQLFLQQNASLTEEKTVYDLQDSVDNMREVIEIFKNEKEEFFKKFDATLLFNNPILTTIINKLGMTKSAVFAKDIVAFNDFMMGAGFKRLQNNKSDKHVYVRCIDKLKQTLTLKESLFEKDGTFNKKFRGAEIEQRIDFLQEKILDDDDFPF